LEGNHLVRSREGVSLRRGLVASIAIVMLLAVLAVSSGLAAAQSRSATRDYIVGTDPLCTILPGVPPEVACPAISAADNGDTISIAGMGTFNPQSKVATGGGTFVHKNAAGDVLGQGTWTAVRVLGFKSYGTAELGDLTLEGGLVLLRVHLVADGGVAEFDGVLQIDCLVGKPPAGAIEGVRLAIQGADLNFNKEIQGLTVYLLT
jgi:hypothetical protein